MRDERIFFDTKFLRNLKLNKMLFRLIDVNKKETEVETMKMLIRKAQKGDTQAFMKLFSRYEQELYCIAFINVKNEADALDVMQETAYRAFKGVKDLKQPEYFKTWLIRIVMNCSLDFIRKNSKVIQLESEHIENLEIVPVSHEKELIMKFTLKELMEVLDSTEKNVLRMNLIQFRFRMIYTEDVG